MPTFKPTILTRQTLIFGLILLTAAGLRLFRLDYRSVWYDESFSLILARQDWPTLISGTANDYHPPLFYLLLSLWLKLFGDSLVAARLLSVLFGLGGIGLVYLFAKALFGPKTGLFAAAVVAIAPFQVLYAQEVRMYSLQFLLGGWLGLTFYRAYRRDSWQDWSWFGLVGLLALYNLYFSMFALAALGLFFVANIIYNWRLHRIWERAKTRRWLITHLVIVGLYLPWLLVLLQQVSRVKNSYWIARPNPLEIFRLLAVFLYNATNLTVDPPFDLAGLLLAALTLLFMLQCARFRLRRGDKGRSRRSFEVALLLVYWLAPVAVVLFLSYVFTPLYLERSLIICAVPVYILLARLFQTARSPNLWPLLLGPGLVLVAISLYFYYFSNDYSVHYDSTAAVAYLTPLAQSGDIVIHSSKISFLPFIYLKAASPQFVVPEEPGNSHDDLSLQTQRAIGLQYTPVEQAVAQAGPGGRVWLVLTPPQPGQTDYQERTVKAFLDKRYRVGQPRFFYGITLYQYQN